MNQCSIRPLPRSVATATIVSMLGLALLVTGLTIGAVLVLSTAEEVQAQPYSNGTGTGQMIVLASHDVLASQLEPKDVDEVMEYKKTQAELFDQWVSDKEARDTNPRDREEEDETTKKTFVLGSNETVNYGSDHGFLNTIMTAYNNHWVLKTCPEDWWSTIRQILLLSPCKCTVSFSKVVLSQGAVIKVFLGAFLMFLAFFHGKIWAKFHFGTFEPYK